MSFNHEWTRINTDKNTNMKATFKRTGLSRARKLRMAALAMLIVCGIAAPAWANPLAVQSLVIQTNSAWPPPGIPAYSGTCTNWLEVNSNGMLWLVATNNGVGTLTSVPFGNGGGGSVAGVGTVLATNWSDNPQVIVVYTNAASQNLPPNILTTYTYSTTNAGLGYAVWTNSLPGAADSNVLCYVPSFDPEPWAIVPSNEIATAFDTGVADFYLAPPGLSLSGNWTDGENKYPGFCVASNTVSVSVTSLAAVGLATNSMQLGGLPATSILSAYAAAWRTNQFLDWWSADTVQTNSGSIVTNWIGRNGNVLAGNAAWNAQGINGHPAFHFDGTGNNILTNGTLLGNQCVQQCTIFCVFRMPPQPQNFLYGSDGPQALLDGMTINGSERAFFAPAYNFGPMFGAFWQGQGGGNLSVEDVPSFHWGDDSQIYCVTWSPTNFADYWDGKLDNWYPKGGSYNDAGCSYPFSGTLALGQLANHVWPFTGYLAELLIYPSQLSNATIDGINHYFLQKYGLIRNVIVLGGDSMMWGGTASHGGTWQDIIATNFPGWSVDNISVPGASSMQIETNTALLAPTACCAGKKVFILWNNLENGGEQIGSITNDQIAMGQMLQSNGWIDILVDPPSNGYNDTNRTQTGGGEPLRFAYQNWATNNWQNYFDGIIDLARDVNVGYSNACTNLLYYPPGGYNNGEPTHWTNATYAETAPYVISAIQAAVNRNYFVSTTNNPPPTPSQPWWSNYGNHFYYNSNGVWVLIH